MPLFRPRQYDGRMSFSETIFLFLLALVIFGPKKLPEIARQAGKWLNEFKRASNEFRSQIEQEIAHLEVENKQTILPPSEPPAGATSRSTYAGAEIEASAEHPALAAAASESESNRAESSSTPVSFEPDQESIISDQASPAAVNSSEHVTDSDHVPESHA